MLIATWMLATPSAAWADEAALPRHGVGIDAMQLYDGNVRLRYEYGLSPSLGVGAILGAGQPYRSQLDTFDTFEVGVHGAFYGVGDRTLGLGLTAQLLWLHGWGSRDAATLFGSNVVAAEVNSDAVLAQGGVSGRASHSSGAFIEANGLVQVRYSVATARGDDAVVRDRRGTVGLGWSAWVGWQF